MARGSGVADLRRLIDAEVRRRLREDGETCKRGHIRTPESVDAKRYCLECKRLDMAARRSTSGRTTRTGRGGDSVSHSLSRFGRAEGVAAFPLRLRGHSIAVASPSFDSTGAG